MHIVWSKVGNVNLIQIHAVQWYRSQLHKPIWFVCGPCQRSINILSPLSPFSAGSDVQDGVCQRLAAADMPPWKLKFCNSEPCVVWSTYLQCSAQRKRKQMTFKEIVRLKMKNSSNAHPHVILDWLSYVEHERRNVLVIVFPYSYNEWGLNQA